MLNWLAKLLLTSTAIAPVLLSYAWVAYRAGEARQALVLVVLVVVLVVISLGVLHYAKTQLNRFNSTATSVEAADHSNMGFLVLYLLPLFTAQYAALNWAQHSFCCMTSKKKSATSPTSSSPNTFCQCYSSSPS